MTSLYYIILSTIVIISKRVVDIVSNLLLTFFAFFETFLPFRFQIVLPFYRKVGCLLYFSAFFALYCPVPPCHKAKKSLANLLMRTCGN